MYTNNFESSEISLGTYVSQVLRRVYVNMFLALIVTAVTAWFVSSSPALLTILFSNTWSVFALMGVEVLLVIAISGAINRLSSSMATLLFYLFAIVNGASLSVILLAYTAQSIYFTFAMTAGVFGAMSIYGYFTQNDLSRMGSFLMMALFGLIIAIVVNIFLGSSQLEWIISIVGIAIFIGLTAWDTQKIKQMAAMSDGNSAEKLATIGALSLYLDFINLCLYLLRFLGNSRD